MSYKKFKVEYRWAEQKIICKHCDSIIPMGKPVLTRHVYNPKQKWTLRFNYHPECFTNEQLFYLGDIPKPIRMHRGRPALNISSEDRLDRRREQKRRSYHLTKKKKCVIIDTEGS